MPDGGMANRGPESTKVLFLCWGFSIHARRRIQIFVDDERFKVAVVSTYNYGFAGALNVLLGGLVVNPTGSVQVKSRGRLECLISPSIKEMLKKVRTLTGIWYELFQAWRDFRTLRDTVREFQPDVVFLQTLQYPSYLAYGLPRTLPIMITFWNGDVTHYAKWTGIEMLIKKLLVVHGIKRATAITVNSLAAHGKCLDHGGTPEKIHLIRYPGADLTRFRRGSRDDARRRLAIDKSQVVLCPRGLGKFFNSDVIVEAAGVVVRETPDVLFLFISGVGGKSEWDRHMRRAKELGISDNLRWDGQVPWEEMPTYYHCANVMVSILAKDSMPNCMIEAMACDLPVILGDTLQSREWVENGINGFLCNPDDMHQCAENILRVLNDPGELLRQFAAINLDKVSREADSAVNSERIKELVRKTAKGSEGQVPAAVASAFL